MQLHDVIEHLTSADPEGDGSFRAGAPRGRGHGSADGCNASAAVALLPTPNGQLRPASGQPPEVRRAAGRQASLADAVQLLPTPTVRDHKGRNQRGDDTCLTGALLPTPRATDGTKGGPNQRGSAGDLMPPSAVMQLLPTPRATRGGSNTETVELNPPRSEGHASNLLDPGLPEPGQGSNVVQEALQEMAGERVSTDSAEGGSETQACIGSVLGDGNEDGLVLAVDWSEGQQVWAREVHADGQEEHESAPLGVGGVGRPDPRRADSRSSLSGAGVREPGTPGAGDVERERQAPSSSDHSLPPGAPTVRREPLSLTSGEPGVQDMSQRGVPSPQGQDWGPYRAAVERWEQIHGPAPAPTKTGKKGGRKLNPEFASWMMGAPPGWITGVPGLTDNQASHAIGNGVVPHQGAAALRILLDRISRWDVA